MAALEVILLERVEKLGQMGDTVRVKPGYARNYLLPQKKALRANESNRRYFETRRADLEAQNLQRREEAQAVADKMQDVSLILVRQAGESGQLYGSVGTRDIQDALKGEGYKVERRQVLLDQPIKQLGTYMVRIGLHPEVTIEISITVARSVAEAEEQQAAAQAAERAEVVTEATEAEEFEAVPAEYEGEEEA